jgi:SAM-dependent methyltransferase
MATTGEVWSAAFASAGGETARVYDDSMVPQLFEPWARLLLNEVGVKTGDVLLDVACGPGTVTRLAAALVGPGGRVTGCDVSPAMLGVARSKPGGGAPVDYVECPADALAVPAGAYDVVTCQQGLQFFGDRQRALGEMHRALRPGGRLGVAVWGPIEQSPPFAALAEAIAEVIGEETAARYRNGPWGLGHDDVAAMVRQAGFAEAEAHLRRLPVVFEGGPGHLLRTLAATAVAADVAALGEAGRRALTAAIEKTAAPLVEDGMVRSEAAAHLVIAAA